MISIVILPPSGRQNDKTSAPTVSRMNPINSGRDAYGEFTQTVVRE